MRMLLAGIEKAGSTKPQSIAKGLEAAALPGGIHYREWDHQLMNSIVAVKPKNPIASADDPVDVADFLPKSSTAWTLSMARACKT